jgi:5-formyltetrahydrofolate cyclo-ligase
MAAHAGGTLTSVAARKQQLRVQLREARKRLRRAERETAARRAACHLIRRRLAGVRRIGVFLSSGQEIDTDPLIQALHARGYQLYAPVTTRNRPLAFVRHHPRARRHRGRFGMSEPNNRRARVAPNRLDCVILPLLGFDRRGGRLGRGAGFYDRTFGARARPRPLLVGYAFAAQECAQIPCEAWDARLHAVVTELGYLRTR